MKGTNLGELEELVLLVIGNLGENAYGLSIKTYIREKCQRPVSISTVHATLHRLENKGYLHSKYDNTKATERGGRPKLVFEITRNGEIALQHSRDLRNKLWNSAPSWSIK